MGNNESGLTLRMRYPSTPCKNSQPPVWLALLMGISVLLRSLANCFFSLGIQFIIIIDCHQIEKVQRAAARWVTSDYSWLQAKNYRDQTF